MVYSRKLSVIVRTWSRLWDQDVCLAGRMAPRVEFCSKALFTEFELGKNARRISVENDVLKVRSLTSGASANYEQPPSIGSGGDPESPGKGWKVSLEMVLCLVWQVMALVVATIRWAPYEFYALFLDEVTNCDAELANVDRDLGNLEKVGPESDEADEPDDWPAYKRITDRSAIPGRQR
jgi:hypothetical protein